MILEMRFHSREIKMTNDKGFSGRIASSFGKEKYDKKKLRSKQLNIALTVSLILLIFTVFFQGCQREPLKTRAQFTCERINDYEVVCKNG